MGLFKKVLQGADKVHDAKVTAEYTVFRDRRFDRADKLAVSGDANEAVITGIRRRYNSGTTDTLVRLEWYGPEPRVGAIFYGGYMPLAIRLGSTVAIRADGDTAVVDPQAMAGVPGAPQNAGRSSRKIPDQGIDDQALDSRVLSRIKKWVPQEATVESLEQVRALGMLTENWTIGVACADGTRAVVSKDEVPPYARWFVKPGAVLPIVTDPKDPGRAQVNWAELAERHAEAGGSWRDRPEDGSIAARVLDNADAEPTTATSMGNEVSFTPAAESVEAIEGVTLERWAYVEAALVKARIPPKEYDAYATAELGVPEGRWTAIKGQWEARQRSDWRIGAAFGAAYSAAQKELKKR
jgi:hypothetical protein